MKFAEFIKQQELPDRLVAVKRQAKAPKKRHEPALDVERAIRPEDAPAKPPERVQGMPVAPTQTARRRGPVFEDHSREYLDLDGFPTRVTRTGVKLMVVKEPPDREFVVRTNALIEEARRASRMLMADPDGDDEPEPVTVQSVIPFVVERKHVHEPDLSALIPNGTLLGGLVMRVAEEPPEYTQRLWDAMGVTTVVDPDAEPLSRCSHG